MPVPTCPRYRRRAPALLPRCCQRPGWHRRRACLRSCTPACPAVRLPRPGIRTVSCPPTGRVRGRRSRPARPAAPTLQATGPGARPAVPRPGPRCVRAWSSSWPSCTSPCCLRCCGGGCGSGVEALGQGAADLAFDRPLHRREQEAELRGHAQLVRRQRDPAVEAGAAEINRVAVPGVLDAELLGQPLRGLLDGLAGARHRQGMGVADVDVAHASLSVTLAWLAF